MFTEVGAATILGVEAHRVAVEADVSDGLPSFSIVGYVTAQVREAGDRVRTAVKNTGLSLPPKRITINLAPADIRKEGPRFDLPIAAAVLCAAGKIPEKPLKASMVLGELGLDGSVRSVSGVLSSVIMARKEGFTTCILPTDNLEEARNIDGDQAGGNWFVAGTGGVLQTSEKLYTAADRQQGSLHSKSSAGFCRYPRAGGGQKGSCAVSCRFS